jgi:hypothetical protein
VERLVTLNDRLPQAKGCLGLHGETMRGLGVRIERHRLLSRRESCGRVAAQAKLAELLEEVGDHRAKAARVAGRPCVVETSERLSADERACTLEEPLPVAVAASRRLREQRAEPIEVGVDDDGRVSELL